MKANFSSFLCQMKPEKRVGDEEETQLRCLRSPVSRGRGREKEEQRDTFTRAIAMGRERREKIQCLKWSKCKVNRRVEREKLSTMLKKKDIGQLLPVLYV